MHRDFTDFSPHMFVTSHDAELLSESVCRYGTHRYTLVVGPVMY